MTVLLFLFLISLGFIAGWFFGSHHALRTPKTPDAIVPVSGNEPEELIAVIAAAASEMLASPVVVKRIQFLGDSLSGTWAVTGRLNIMASHQISKRTI
jgi:hypothetical protein